MRDGVPNVLSIAGSDPGGGAGIQADLKTFAALGVYGCAVPAVLTAQNTRAVSRVFALPADFLRSQLDAVFADIRIDAVKIGMLGSREAVAEVAEAVRRYRPPIVVLDPVLRSSTDARLLDDDALDVLRFELLPLATVVTPNAMEAGALLECPAPRTIDEARAAAAALARFGSCAVLVTGGHVESNGVCTDVLYAGDDCLELSVERVGAGNHGTGCTLSSAVATYLALGHALPSACARGQQFVVAAMRASASISVGAGVAPLHHAGVRACR